MEIQGEEHWMKLALEQADLAAAAEEIPVGAVVIHPVRGLIGLGNNRTRRDCDPSAHAEIVALRAAAQAVGNHRLVETTLITTLEPCPMCAGAIVQARVARVIFGCRDPRMGAAVSVFSLLDHPALNHRCTVDEGLFADESRERLQSFFQARRKA